MGVLRIGETSRYIFSDESLAYLQATITARLELRHAFTLQILHHADDEPVTNIALTPDTALWFLFDTRVTPDLDDKILRWMTAEIELTGTLHCAEK